MSSRPDPLQELLELLTEGAAYTLASLARRLGVEPPLLEEMLATLRQADYVDCVDLSSCVSCGRGDCAARATPRDDDAECVEEAHGACGMTHGSRIWTVTPRGRRVIGGA